MSEGRPADCNSVLVDTAWPDRGHYRRHVPLRRRRGSSFSAGDGEAFLLALVLAQMLARLEFRMINRPPLSRNLLKRLATPAGLEPATSRLEGRSEEHTSELQSRRDLVCRFLLEKKK